MITTTQIKLNLPVEMKSFAELKAKKYGVTLAGYVKFLLFNEIQKEEYKTFVASDRLEKVSDEALKNKNKRIFVDNVDEFFAKL